MISRVNISPEDTVPLEEARVVLSDEWGVCRSSQPLVVLLEPQGHHRRYSKSVLRRETKEGVMCVQGLWERGKRCEVADKSRLEGEKEVEFMQLL
ncbi:hypothetical protein E2C01_083929 [Portunus trituberculatus]|uniref:Uncharacterized protein n=1 Tax=Portunus trituberculatus TaxID=210409 RepID=A0A5B7ITZ4_PORTR|nr:hypothetical protein [Portunus trituberculatus]